MKRNFRVYLDDILESVGYIEEDTAQLTEHDFFMSRRIQDSVMRRLEIIGEAAKRVPEEIKKQHSAVPWREVAGTRDVLIHEYSGVKLEMVWNVIQHDLPVLKRQIQDILKDVE